MSKQDYRELEAYRALGKPEELCKKQGWISVKSRKKPEENQCVIVCVKVRPTLREAERQYITTATRRVSGKKIYWDEWGRFNPPLDKVTHWMPLPEPPKEDSDG